MATIRDIARIAGVSKSTVSNVLNGRLAHVSAETLERVHEAMRSVNYHPNRVARSLVMRQTNTIGVLIGDISHTAYTTALRAAARTFSQAGYNVVVADVESDATREPDAVANLLERRVDGVLFIGSSAVHPSEHLVQVGDASIPLVLVNRDIDHPSIDSIVVDNRFGIGAAVDHLVEMGHTRIGTIYTRGHRIETRASIERREAFFHVMAKHQLQVEPEWVREGDYGSDLNQVRSGFRAAIRILSADNRPTAIVCTSDYIAVGAVKAAKSLGLCVPQDVAITGHDDTAMGRFHDPAITSVQQPMDQAGEFAATRLLDRVQGRIDEEALPLRLMLRGALRIRRSTDPKADDLLTT